MEIVNKKIKELTPFEGNPRQRTEQVLNHLVKSIKEHGFVEPIILWANAPDFGYPANCIIGGHRRIDALNWLIENEGMDNIPIPCVEIEVDGIAKAKILNIALNKIGEQFDYPMLKDWLVEIDTGAIDIEVTGFTEVEVKEIFDYEPSNYYKEKDETDIDKIIDGEGGICPKCGYEW